MKTLKKALVLLLSLSLLLTYQASVFADDVTEEISIVEEEFNIEESPVCNKLTAFGIFEDDELAGVFYDEYLSRGDFIKYAVRVGKIEHIDYSNLENPFSDVESDADYYAEVLAAYKLGIISGAGNTVINPQAQITTQEAAKILLNILGYKDIVALDGGYPTGYMKWANKLRLFTDCSFNGSSFISPENFVQILLNTLEAPVLDMDGVAYTSNSDMMFSLGNDGESLLNYAHSIYETNGIVDSNEYTSIYGDSTVDEGQTSINETMYYIGSTSVVELLGRNVQAYYRLDEDKDERTLLYIETSEGKNDITVVKSEDILPDGVTSSNFSYLENGERRVDTALSNIAVLIYNGRQEAISKTLLCPDFGDVTLIDNNSDGKIDVVSVMSYRTVWASGVSAQTYSVSDEFGGTSLVLDPEDKAYDVIITRDGKEASFEDILLSNVISYAQSLTHTSGKTVKRLIISSETVDGKVDAMSDDFISINGEDYKTSDEFRQNISLNVEGTFFLDHTGRIVAKDAGRDFVFGYLNRFAKIGTLGSSVVMQIFTENNRWVELELNDNVRVNDSSRKKPQEFYDTYWDADPNTYRQLITYNVNEEGKIVAINFAQTFTAGSAAEKAAIENGTFRLSSTKVTGRYRLGLKSFDNDILLADKTKIFLIPDQSVSDAEESDFRIVNLSYFTYDTDYYNISAYNMDDFRLAGACVLEDERNFRTVFSNDTSKLMVVTGQYGFSNKNGDEGDGLKGIYNGNQVWLPLSNTISPADYPKKGDVIRFGLDTDGYAIDLTKLYESKNGDNQKFLGSTYLYSGVTSVCGEITDTDIARARLKINYGASADAIFYWNTGTLPTVYVYDKQDNEVAIGSVNDLLKGSSVYVSVHNFRIYEVVVFE